MESSEAAGWLRGELRPPAFYLKGSIKARPSAEFFVDLN